MLENKMARYWLFQIIERHVPGIWYASLTHSLAIQSYIGCDDPGTPNAKRSVHNLQKLSRGDWLIGGFTKHQFGGYGTLATGLYKGEAPIRGDADGDCLKDPLFERFDCSWTAIPPEDGYVYVVADDLKDDGYDIDFLPGLPVKEIDERSFLALKKRLDANGAVPRGDLPDEKRPGWGSIEETYEVPSSWFPNRRPFSRFRIGR